MNLKTLLISLSCAAGLLIIVTFYVVFYSGGGTYVVSSTLGPDAGIFSTSTSTSTPLAGASSTASSTLAFGSPSASSTATSTPAPTQIGQASVSWTQGNETLSVTSASLTGAQLTLNVQVVMGSVAECVPLNLRLIADEQGDISPPITPQFTFPDTGSCNGTPGEIYSAQPVVFTLSTPGAFPIVLTTGGTANLLFEVDQNADGSLTAELPPSAD
jgi:hypothetical protein